MTIEKRIIELVDCYLGILSNEIDILAQEEKNASLLKAMKMQIEFVRVSLRTMHPGLRGPEGFYEQLFDEEET